MDGTFFIYKLASRYGKDVNMIVRQFKRNTLEKLVAAGIIPIIVFDGSKPVPEKFKTNQKRTKRKLDCEEKLVKVKVMFNEAMKLKHDQASGGDSEPSIIPIDPSNVPITPIVDVAASGVAAIPGSTTPSPEEVKIILASAGYSADDSEETEGKGMKPSKWIKELVEKGDYIKKINSVEKQTSKVDGATIDEVMTKLTADGYICIRSESEGDFVMAHLSRQGHVKYVFADDGDLFVFGVANVVRNLSEHLYDKSKPLHVYNLETMLRQLKFKQEQLVETCILAKCDYVPNCIKGIGCVKAYKGILKYKIIEEFLDNNPKLEYEDSFLEEVELARKLFKNPRSGDYLLNLAEKHHEIFRTPNIREIITSF